MALEVVAEKTGYPVEMLDLDMEMEAGLGIDSIKRTEIFGSLLEQAGLAKNDQDKEQYFLTVRRLFLEQLSINNCNTEKNSSWI